MTNEHIPDYTGRKITEFADEMEITPAEVLESTRRIQQKMKAFIMEEEIVASEEEAEQAVQNLFLHLPDGSSYVDNAFFDKFKPEKKGLLAKIGSLFSRKKEDYR